MKTVEKLTNNIMQYWEECAYRDTDFKVNNLIYDYCLLHGINQDNIECDVRISVYNLSNSNKRKLYKLLIESNIR